MCRLNTDLVIDAEQANVKNIYTAPYKSTACTANSTKQV